MRSEPRPKMLAAIAAGTSGMAVGRCRAMSKAGAMALRQNSPQQLPDWAGAVSRESECLWPDPS